MKVSVFFEQYCPFHEEKDPGQIPLGLLETGTNTSLITLEKKELIGYHPSFPVIKKTIDELYSERFWAQEDSDAIICYTWLTSPYTPLIEKMKASGKRIIIKCDRDGRVEYPFKSTFLRPPLRERLTIAEIKRSMWWSLPIKSLHAKTAFKIIKQIELSDGVIIESPDALSNLNFFLTAWGRRDLIKKAYFVPNPVSPEFVEGDIGKKENLAVSFGRWGDFRQKNTQVMVETAVELLTERLDYKFLIFGKGIEEVKKIVSEVPENAKDRIEILGFVEREKIKNLLTSAKIYFVPSRWESFSIAAAEALCLGCSIVGTPVEPLRYLSMEGFSGSVAATFDKEAISSALMQDVIKWDNEEYNSQKISAYWRAKLDRKTVAKKISKLVQNSYSDHSKN
jgi:glycosyltransferase involved in cell wall biosynthesis